jgi:hypothetical protein
LLSEINAPPDLRCKRQSNPWQSWPVAQQIAGRLPVTILVPLMDRRVGRRYWAEKVKSRTRNRGGADLRDDAHILASRSEDRWTRN